MTRKEARERLAELTLCCELARVIKRFFPQLLMLLEKVRDPRHQSYVTYGSKILLMTRILSSIFYIGSMRKTSAEFNSERMIENIGVLCGEEGLEELPYWETVNDFLSKLSDEQLRDIIIKLVKRLLRMRIFEDSRIRGKYWQVIIDGTRLESSRKALDPHCLYSVHNRGEENEYTEYYYYVLEAKIVLADNIVVSIMTEFVENEGSEMKKQDCELKAAYRLTERLKKEFPLLPICICADSLYAGGPFFQKCEEKKWHYIIRFKDGSIPGVAQEYIALKKVDENLENEKLDNGNEAWYDHVNSIDFNGREVNMLEYGEQRLDRKILFRFITDLNISRRNRKDTVTAGRKRWKIENEGFNRQKRHGYYLEHMFSRNYQAMKNHYLLIQIGHMISQIIEAWKCLWDKIKLSIEQKHIKILDSFKQDRLKECLELIEKPIQIRLR